MYKKKQWSEIVTIVSGKNQKDVADKAGPYPIYGSGGVIGYASDYLCEAGATIIGRKGTINNPIYVDEPFWNIDTAFGIVPSDEIDSLFLYYFCLYYNFAKLDKSTTLPSLAKKDLLKIEMPVPDLAEQARIVSGIEEMFSELDNAEETLQATKSQLEVYRQAVLKEAFNGNLTAKWRKENAISDVWEQLTLDDVGEYKKGPFGSSITKAMFVPKGPNTYKVYEQGNAIQKTLNYGHYYISESKFQELKGFAVKPGDIIVSCAGTIGEVFKLPDTCEEGVINQALMRVRLRPCITDKFFMYYFEANIRSEVKDNAKGTAMVNIPPFKIMKAMKISLPSIQEQKQITSEIEDRLSACENIVKTVELTLHQGESLRQSILKQAFEGDLK